jgi:hypothetical protein
MTADPAIEAARLLLRNVWTSQFSDDRDAIAKAVVAAIRPVIVEECAQAVEAAPDGKWVRYTKTDYANILRALAGTETQA